MNIKILFKKYKFFFESVDHISFSTDVWAFKFIDENFKKVNLDL